MQGGKIGHASLKLETDHETLLSGKNPGSDDETMSPLVRNKKRFVEAVQGSFDPDGDGSWLEFFVKLPTTALESEKADIKDEVEPENGFLAEVSFVLPAEQRAFIAGQIKNQQAFCDQQKNANADHCQYRSIGNNCVDHVQNFFKLTGKPGHFSDYYSDEDMVKAGSGTAFYARPGLTTLSNWLGSDHPGIQKLQGEIAEITPSLTTVVGGIGAAGLIGYAAKRYLSKPRREVSDQHVSLKSLKSTLRMLHKQNHRLEKALDRQVDNIDKALHKEMVSDYIDTSFEFDDLHAALEGGNHPQSHLKYCRTRIKKLKKSQSTLSKKLALFAKELKKKESQQQIDSPDSASRPMTRKHSMRKHPQTAQHS